MPDITKTLPVEETKTRRLPPYHVILLNDDHHSMPFVMEVLCKVLGCPVERAFELMLLAHNSGLPGYVEFFKTHVNATGVLRACLEVPLEATPGERAEYSDPGFILLCKALEVRRQEGPSCCRSGGSGGCCGRRWSR